jgi:hypothetical protein
MQELRFVAVSEDGSYAVLAVPGRSGRYILPIDERLRAVAQGQTSRLAQYEIEVESPLRPKEIQARIRAGETAEEIADAAGIPVERVRWFEGPVLGERAYIADQAQAGSVRRAGDSSGPGPRLGEIVTARLSAAGTDPADGQWDSRKRGDGNWQVSLTFPSGGRLHVAEWVFDPRRRHVMPDDDNAARLSLPESELPAEPVPVPGEATVTPIASRLGAAAGMGGGSVGGSGVSRFRPDRSVIPDRSLGADRSLVDQPMPPSAPAPERTAMSDRPALSDRYAAPEQPPAPPPPVPPRSAQQERPPQQNRPASYDYVEFPESAPYRVPEPAPEQPAQRDPAPEAAYRAPATQQPAFRDQAPEPAAYGAPAAGVPAAAHVPAGQVSAAPAVEDSERVRPAPPRPVIFEDPEPAFPGDQPELPQDLATPQPAPATAPRAAEPAHAANEPAAPSPASRPEPRAAAVAAPSAPATSVTRAPAAATEVTAAPEPAVAAQPEIRAPEPVAAQVTSSTDMVTPREAEAQAEPAAAAEPVTTAVSAAPGAAEPGATSEPAAPAAPARPEPKADVPAPAEPSPAEDAPSRARSGAKKNAKARRSSVPSWDEIMLGSSRPRE